MPDVRSPLPQARGHRTCADCGKRMGYRDKWFIGGDGKLHHKNCASPVAPGKETPEPERSQTLELLEAKEWLQFR